MDKQAFEETKAIYEKRIKELEIELELCTTNRQVDILVIRNMLQKTTIWNFRSMIKEAIKQLNKMAQ